MTTDHDRHIIRSLAARVAELAALPEQAARRALWREHNDRRGPRPLIVVYVHDAWPEFWALECQDPVLRDWEWILRHRLYCGSLPTDVLTTPDFPVGYVLTNSYFGQEPRFRKAGEGGSYAWEAALRDSPDLARLRPGIGVDLAATAEKVGRAQDLLGDLLTVRRAGVAGGPLDETAAFLRGMDRLMLDLYERPDFVHRLMSFIRDQQVDLLRRAEAEGWLTLQDNDQWWLCAELPGADFDGQVRLKDLAGNQAGQAFVGVSPRQFEEFLFPYQRSLLELYGLCSYGCCEPLHDRLHLILQLPHLRRVTVSPWSDLRVCAEMLADRVILVHKLHPMVLGGAALDPEVVRRELREILAITRGCHVELHMKDQSTVRGEPGRLEKWAEIASEMAQEST